MFTTKTTIKMWAEDDRPREKMLLKGRHALSDSELIAILIGSGTREMSAVEVAQKLLETAHHNLSEFSKMNIEELCAVKGIGEAKAVTIVAALELGRRRKEISNQKRSPITSSEMIYQHMRPYFEDLKYEQFYVIILNRRNYILDTCLVSQGGMTGTVVDGKIIFQKAIEKKAEAIILSHNHPGGTMRPSQQDIDLTRKLKSFGDLIEIRIIDHVIFTENGFYSFADSGQL